MGQQSEVQVNITAADDRSWQAAQGKGKAALQWQAKLARKQYVTRSWSGAKAYAAALTDKHGAIPGLSGGSVSKVRNAMLAFATVTDEDLADAVYVGSANERSAGTLDRLWRVWNARATKAEKAATKKGKSLSNDRAKALLAVVKDATVKARDLDREVSERKDGKDKGGKGKRGGMSDEKKELLALYDEKRAAGRTHEQAMNALRAL